MTEQATTTAITTGLKTVDPKEFGIEEVKARQMQAMFDPMLNEMSGLEVEFNHVRTLGISKATCKEAKALRLKYVKIRTATAKVHKEGKAFYLAAGRFIDGLKNAQLFASQGIEDKLKGIEDHYENLETERIAELQVERIAELAKYDVDGAAMDLGSMADDVWSNYLTGTKSGHEIKIAAEKKAEEDRLAAEKAEADRLEAQRLENEKLKEEAEKREAVVAAERAKAQAEKQALTDKLDADRIAAEKEIQRQKDIAETERLEKEKVQQQIAKAEAEHDAEKERTDVVRAETVTCPNCGMDIIV